MISTPTLLAIAEWTMTVLIPSIIMVAGLRFLAKRTNSRRMKWLSEICYFILFSLFGLKIWVSSGIAASDLAKMGPSKAGIFILMPILAAFLTQSLFRGLIDPIIAELTETQAKDADD